MTDTTVPSALQVEQWEDKFFTEYLHDGGFKPLMGTNENAVVAFDASTLSSFFTVANPNRIGAAWTGNNAWYTGWTCNGSTANLGGATSCTSLPTT